MNAETDSYLLLRWQRHQDAHAFREIANRHSAMVFATCRRILRDAVEAEDLTQECFLSLAQHADRPPDSLPAWLHVVAVRRSLSRLRALGRRASRERRYADEQTGASEPAMHEVLAEVDEALAALQESLREPLVLHFLEQRGQGEIAAQLGVAQSTVSRRIDRGIAELRAHLEKRHVFVTAGALAAGLQAESQAAVPPSLGAALGKLSLGGKAVCTSGAGVSAVKLAAITGGILMKKLWVAAIGIGILALGAYWAVSKRPVPPTPSGGSAPVESAEKTEPDATETARPVVAADRAPARANEDMATAEFPVADREGAISGHVLDAVTGEGIAGVRVTAKWNSTGNGAADTDEELGGVSDAEGAYRIDHLAGTPGTRYELTRDTPKGYRQPSHMERISVVLDTSGQISGVDFKLGKEAPLSGIVVDENGRAVGGAKVWVAGGFDFFVSESAETDSGGRFAFHSLPPTVDLTITARSGKTQASEPYDFTLPAEGITDLKLTLAAACAVSGNVVDTEGKALEGYVVHCLRVPQGRRGGGDSSEQSGHNGSFALTGLASGDYELVVLKTRMASTGANQKGYPVSLQAGQQLSDVTLVYERDSAIAGRITTLAGDAIEGISVRAGSAHLGGGDATSDSAGQFVIENLEDGDYQVDVMPKDGYQHMSLGGVPAGTMDLQITLPEYFRITGRVLDGQTGQPLPRFEIALEVNWADSLNSWTAKQFQTVSNPEGRFELQQVQLYSSMLAARAPGYATAMKVLDLTGPPYEHEVELRLEPGNTLTGMVVDSTGAPVAGASIYYGKIEGVGGDRAMTQSAADGSFQLDSFPAQPQMVSTYHPSYAPAWVVVEGAARFQPLEIVLSDGGVIEGTVVFPDGAEPVACQASIMFAEYHFIPSMSVDVAADGTFLIEHVKPGEADVVLTAGSDRPWQERLLYTQTVAVQSGQVTAVQFEVRPGTGGLEGIVLCPEGALPSRIQLILVCATNGGTVKRLGLATPGGGFYFDGVPAGRAEIEIDANFQNHRRISTTVEVEVPEGDVGFAEIGL